MNKKIIAIIGAFTFTFGFVSACSNKSEVACASIVIDDNIYTKSGGSTSSGSGSSSSGSKSSGSSSSGSKSSPGGASSPGSKSGGVASGQKSSSQSSASKNSKPTSKPSSSDVSKAKSEAPQRVTRGGSYYSSVTGTTYVYHDVRYYNTPGIYLDIYDPYNPWNYWRYTTSPFYGRPYMVAGDCGDEKPVEVKNETNISIEVDADGKVVSTTDSGGVTTGTTPGTTP